MNRRTSSAEVEVIILIVRHIIDQYRLLVPNEQFLDAGKND